MTASVATKSKPKAFKKSTASTKSAGHPTEEKMSIFQVIAGLEQALQRPVPRNVVSVYAGKADKTVKNELSKLKTKGHIDYDSKTIRLTSAGQMAIGSSIPTITISKDAATTRIKNQHNLGKKECAILDILSNGRPQAKKLVMEKADFNTNKTFANALCKLKKLEIVEYTDNKKSVQLTDKLFPFGRPHAVADTTTSDEGSSTSSLTARFEIANPIGSS